MEQETTSVHTWKLLEALQETRVGWNYKIKLKVDGATTTEATLAKLAQIFKGGSDLVANKECLQYNNVKDLVDVYNLSVIAALTRVAAQTDDRVEGSTRIRLDQHHYKRSLVLPNSNW